MHDFELIKYNRSISIIFLILTIFFGFFGQYFFYFKFSNLVCLILILTIGITHGSLDNIKGKKLLKKFKLKKESIFYFSYITFSFLIIILWLIFPSLMLFIFLVVASYHFGKEDTLFNFVDQKINKNFQILFLLKGSIIVLAPLIFHYEQTVDIFSNLFLKDSIFFNILEFMKSDIYEGYGLLNLLLVISIFAGIGLHGHKKSVGAPDNLGGDNFIPDTLSIIFLNIAFNPVMAFTIYFCFLHSPRHSLSLIKELDKKNFTKGFKKFLKKALPLTLITAILFLASIYFLNNYYVLDSAILKVIFIGLASLTFPHILLEYLIEKNERK